MSPEQLKILQHLSQLFEEGRAGPSQIRELSILLADINKSQDQLDIFSQAGLSHSRSNSNRL